MEVRGRALRCGGDRGPGRARVAEMSTPEDVAGQISVQGAASARVEVDGKTVYFDPFFDEKTPAPAAELILITHGHDRHCSPATVARILKPETTIVAPEACARTLREKAKRPITTTALDPCADQGVTTPS